MKCIQFDKKQIFETVALSVKGVCNLHMYECVCGRTLLASHASWPIIRSVCIIFSFLNAASSISPYIIYVWIYWWPNIILT